MSISVFLQFARLSLTAGWMILVLLALRPLLKKVPRKFSCLLWALVAVRLAFPFSLESRVSMIPQAAASPLQIVDSLPPIQREQVFQTVDSVAVASISWNQIIPILWAVGIALMLAYAVVSFLRLHWLVRVSAPAGKGTYICDRIRTPFILGIAKPRVYLPSDLDAQTAASVLAHEQAHLRRGDHLWKPFGYALLSVYWFNPLCWVAYLLFCRDVEQACDEAVIRNMTQQEKKKYSAALLACSMPRSMGACPLAFAEVGVKQRIAGIVSYRKPKFWVTVTAAVLCIALTAGLLTDPVKAANKDEPAPAATEAASAAVAEPAAQAVKAAATKNVNVRLAPSPTSRTLVTLEKGEEVSAVGADTVAGITWVYIRLDALETTGWVVADYLNLDEEALGSLPSLATELPEDAFGTQAATLPSLENSVKTTVKETLNVHLAPSLKSSAITSLGKGQEVSAIGADVIGGITWVYISLDDQETRGWAVADYLDLAEEALDALPSMVIEPSAGADTANAATAPTTEGNSSVTVTKASDLYSAPAESSRVVGQLVAGEPVTVLRTDVISGTSWSYVSKTSENTFGWVLTDCLNVEVAKVD